MKNYKEKLYVRVLRNTRFPEDEEMNAMIGKVCEVWTWYPHKNTVAVYTPDKSDYFVFNTSDLQIVKAKKYQ